MKMKKMTQIAVLVGIIFLLTSEFVFTCTSFALNHKGYLIFGTNYDNSFAPGLIFVNKKNVQKTGWEPSTNGKIATWVSKYGSVTFSVAGSHLAWAGMNEAGLVISTMSLSETKVSAADERPPLVSPLWMQYILDTCGSVEEVIEIDRRIRNSDTRDHYLVCDRKGNGAALEFLEGKMVYHTQETLPVKVLANGLYSVCADHWKRKAPLTSQPYHSINRFVRAANLMASYQPKDNKSAIDYAFKILKNVIHPREELTRWSIVFDTRNFMIYFRSYNNQKIRRIDFKKLDFHCHTPIKMLDVHQDLSGDISDSFIDYSHEINLNLTVRAVKNFRPEFEVEKLMPLLQMMERFPCKSKSPGN
ncbi:MAG: linear amide C-N hydrolase [Candidatus Aminicenantes bacterium]|nr:MAG: linear amide C-N hydrolase [Candidatus Aminicenantes bacterium]